MKTQETQEPQIVPPALGKRLTLKRVKQIVAEHREALEALAKHDGPVEQPKKTISR